MLCTERSISAPKFVTVSLDHPGSEKQIRHEGLEVAPGGLFLFAPKATWDSYSLEKPNLSANYRSHIAIVLGGATAGPPGWVGIVLVRLFTINKAQLTDSDRSPRKYPQPVHCVSSIFPCIPRENMTGAASSCIYVIPRWTNLFASPVLRSG